MLDALFECQLIVALASHVLPFAGGFPFKRRRGTPVLVGLPSW